MQVNRIYARVDVLELATEQHGRKPRFKRSSSVYLLGEGKTHAKVPDAIHLSNKKLVAELSSSVVKTLMLPVAKGGAEQLGDAEVDDEDDDEEDWGDLETDDIEELLLTDKTADQKADSRQIQLVDNVQSYTFYSQDKAADVREMVALVTGIDPYKQYLWVPAANRSLVGDELSLMDHWAISLQFVDMFPVDVHPRSSRSFATAPLESFLSTGDGRKDPAPAVVFSCVSLDTIARSNASALLFLAHSDSESFERVYLNTIKRFFPHVSISVFNQYLVDATLVSSLFPKLRWSHDALECRYSFRRKLFTSLGLEPGGPDPQKMQKKKKEVDKKIVTATAINLVFSRTANDAADTTSDRMDTMNLFQLIDITAANCADVADIDLYGVYSSDAGKPMRLRKTRQQDHFRARQHNQSVRRYANTKQQLIRSRTLVFNFLPRGECASLALGLARDGSVWIRTRPARPGVSVEDFCLAVAEMTNPLIHSLNATLAGLLGNRQRLEPFSYATEGTASGYRVISSSSRVSFAFSPSYPKLLDVLISTLGDAGLVARATRDESSVMGSAMVVTYGVSAKGGEDLPAIEIASMDGVAVLALANFDPQETEFYLDVLDRIVTVNPSRLEMSKKAHLPLVAADPALYRPQVGVDKYRRICQRQFQPVITTKDDPDAVEYRNFTFNRPEYYKCPNARMRELGFISNKHPQGFCLPCCRKVPQPNIDAVQQRCRTDNDGRAEEEKDDGGRGSTYKMSYPSHDVPNAKITGRRVIMPEYLSRLLGLGDIVANGSVIAVHGLAANGMDPNSPEHMQTLAIIASAEGVLSPGHVPYSSERDLVIDIVGMLKQPLRQAAVMRSELVSARFTTPLGFLHAFDDRFLRETALPSAAVVPTTADLSSAEWNDLLVYLANCLGLNVMLLVDNRSDATSGIQLANIGDVDPRRRALVLLKRVNSEWALRQTEARAMYLPVTKNSFRALAKSRLALPRFNLEGVLGKIYRVERSTEVTKYWKLFTLPRINAMLAASPKYSMSATDSQRKLVTIATGNELRLVTTVASLDVASAAGSSMDVSLLEPTASLEDALAFVDDYNTFVARAVPHSEQMLRSYKLYLSAALQGKGFIDYKFVNLDAFLLKVERLAIHQDQAIGAVVAAVNDLGKSESSELLFFAPVSVEAATATLTLARERLLAYHAAVDAEAILTFPVSTWVVRDDTQKQMFIQWFTNPLSAAKQLSSGIS